MRKRNFAAIGCPAPQLNFLLIVAFVLQGCAMSVEFYKQVDTEVASERYASAAKIVQENRETYRKNSTVLYNLECGLLLHYAGDYDLSNRHFLESEREMDDLYTQSISKGVGSMVLNDYLLPYEGENFEKVYVNLFLALNYARLGKIEDAIVEARKVDLKLNEYSRQYEGKNSYKQDAFVRYIMGVLYEADGEVNDAFISYRSAYEGYKAYDTLFATRCPSYLKDDLVRTAGELGFQDELVEYEREFGIKYTPSQPNTGRLLVVVYSGRGPVKEEVKLKVSIMDQDGTVHTFIAAVPKFHSRQNWVNTYSVSVSGNGVTDETQPELGENVNAIAEKNLDERISLIYLKTAGRALLKFLAAEQAKKEVKKQNDSPLANFLTSVVVDAAYDASEKADVRTWMTLPHDIQIALIRLPAGEFSVGVIDQNGEPVMSKTVVITPRGLSVELVPDLK